MLYPLRSCHSFCAYPLYTVVPGDWAEAARSAWVQVLIQGVADDDGAIIDAIGDEARVISVPSHYVPPID